MYQNLDKIIHEPVRLAIMKILSMSEEADFMFLLTSLQLTKGNLATHIDKLEKAGYVKVKKQFIGKQSHTSYVITKNGQNEFEKYWKIMNRLSP